MGKKHSTPKIGDVIHHTPIQRLMTHLPTGAVGRLAPIYPEDVPYRSARSTEVLLRYFDYWKFEKLLSTSSLCFARPDTFDDKFEGRIMRGNPIQLSRSDEALHKIYNFSGNDSEGEEVMRKVVFISCWTRRTCDTWEMWKAYTRSSDSVVVSTTVGALKLNLPSNVLLSGVQYQGLEKPRTRLDYFSPFFFKPTSCKFENEFRLLRMPLETESFDEEADKMRLIKVPLKKIIHRVILHPGASLETQEKVRQLLRQFLPSRNAVLSALPKMRR